MEIEFLGSGSAFVLAEENYHSNILIKVQTEDGEKRLLIDAGTTIPESLNAAGYKPQDIDAILITHLHADHAGGIEYLAFKNYFEQFPFGVKKPTLIGHHKLLKHGWKHTWSGGLKTLSDKEAKLDTYFDLFPMGGISIYYFHGVSVSIFKTDHVSDNGDEVPSFGVKLIENGKTTIITGDSKFNYKGMKSLYKSANVIFQDCEIAKYPNPVHAQYHELVNLPIEIKNKMWLYHYSTKNGTIILPDVVSDGFLGFILRGDKLI
jgi:ribonuclease BN (tRNA processing enzyme)